jgi:hypothetical protein
MPAQRTRFQLRRPSEREGGVCCKPELAGVARSPIYWSPTLMENRDNRGGFSTDNEEHAERELAEQRALNGFADQRKLSRILRDALEHDVQLPDEALNEGGIARAIPLQGLIDVGLRARADDDAGHS